MRKAVFWLFAGFGCAGVGVAFALVGSAEVGIALVVLGAVELGVAVGLAWSSDSDMLGGSGAITKVEQVELDDKEQHLGELISKRCDWVWEGIRDRRYVKYEDGRVVGPDGGAIFVEVQDIVKEVAALYHADSDDAMLEARIGDIVLAFRSASGDFLQRVRQIPYIDPAGWSVREVMTRLEQVQKGVELYRRLSPYQHYARGAMIAARLALGANPVSLAAWYVGGEAAKRVFGKVLGSIADAWLKDLLEGSVALVYLQVARTYDPRLAYRSADWVALVEVLRIHARIPGIDHNRKLLLDHILRAQILDEFAKMALLRALAADREPDARTIPPVDFVPLPPEQRQAIADRLRNILSEMKGLNVPTVGEMIEDLERRLECGVGIDVVRSGSPDYVRVKKGFVRGWVRSAKALLWRGWRSGRRALSRSENSP